MQTLAKPIQKNNATKADKVLELSEYIASLRRKFKSIRQGFNEERKRAEKELEDILNDDPTTLETISNISDIHDVDFSE